MDLGKKILCLLAIFCILGSCIAAVSTADTDGYCLDVSHDGHNGTIIPPDVNHNEEKCLNENANATNESVYVLASGECAVIANNSAVAAAHSNLPATGNSS